MKTPIIYIGLLIIQLIYIFAKQYLYLSSQ
jgi:hypothetical protein